LKLIVKYSGCICHCVYFLLYFRFIWSALSILQLGLLVLLKLLDGLLQPLSVLYDLLHEHLGCFLGIVAWREHAVGAALLSRYFRELDSARLEVSSLFNQLLLFSLVLLNFVLKDMRDRLVSRGIEVICQGDVCHICEIWVVIDRWV